MSYIGTISKDHQAFATGGLIEIMKSMKPNTTNPKVAAMMGIYLELLHKGYVSQDGLKSRIALRGRWYLFCTHFSVGFWGVVAGFIGGAATIAIPFYILLLTKSQPQPTEQKMLSSPVVPVYPPTNQKDTSKKK